MPLHQQKFCVSSEMQKPFNSFLSNSVFSSFFHIQFWIPPTGCRVFSHSVNPRWSVCCEWLQVLMPRSFSETLLLTGRRRGVESPCLAGLEDFLGWLRIRRIPTPVPPLSPSPAIREMLAAVLPCLSRSLPASLSLTHTHKHTPSSLPASLLSLSLFLSSAQPLFPPTARRGVSARLLAARSAICKYSLSLSTHTHTHPAHIHTRMHPTTRHMNT